MLYHTYKIALLYYAMKAIAVVFQDQIQKFIDMTLENVEKKVLKLFGSQEAH